MQDYERKSISEVVEEINRKYFLPDIQRDFVWKPNQVYALFDSILRDYPISTFLFWKQYGEYIKKENIKKLEFVKTSQDKNNENTELESSKEYMLVLDGQQRLTTFYPVLKGNYIMRKNPYDLYFNVLSGEKEQDDGMLYEFKFSNKDNGDSYISEEDDIKKLWFRVKDIYDISIGQVFTDINKISQTFKEKYSIELSDPHRNNIAKLCSYLKSEKIIYYYPEVEKDYDKVLDIFVRTNSGGTKLTYSDLLFSTIKSKWNQAREKFDTLLTNINSNDKYSFSNDFVLKTILVIYANSQEQVRYKTKNFKSEVISKLKENWDEIEKAIQLCTDFLNEIYLTSDKTISSYNALIPIIYWIYKSEKKGFGAEQNCISDYEINKIRTWLTKALLSGIFGGQSDTILYKCKEVISSSQSNSFPGVEIESKINSETKKSMRLDEEFLDKISYNSRDSHFVLSIIYKGNINFTPKMKGNIPEQDHIFSQGELKSANISDEKINSIYNIRLIGSSENKIKSDTPYAEWIKSIGENKDELKKHLIPEGNWTSSDYNNFLLKRKEMIKNNFSY